MLKKVLMIALSLLFVSSVSAFAWGPPSVGYLDIDAQAGSADLDLDGKMIPNGGALGISGAIGCAKSDADGFIVNGTIEGEVDVIGGGLSNTDAYRFHVPADRSIGVGSESSSYAITGASAKIKVDPGYGFGEADAHIRGFAAQGTLNVSALGESPIFFETDGFTGGIAAQGSLGGFEGYAFAVSGPDYWSCEIVGYRCGKHGCRPIYRPVKKDSKAGAGMGAEIEMFGSSYSESYRYVNYDCGSKTEGMGTNVGAFTTVYSYGYDYDWDKGLGCSYADVDGGWIAAGGAATLTVQEGPAGNAKASAIGIYVGCGQLGDNYNGSAAGYSNTSVTTFNGMGGSINQASSGMVVTSGNNNGGIQQQQELQ